MANLPSVAWTHKTNKVRLQEGTPGPPLGVFGPSFCTQVGALGTVFFGELKWMPWVQFDF